MELPKCFLVKGLESESFVNWLATVTDLGARTLNAKLNCPLMAAASNSFVLATLEHLTISAMRTLFFSNLRPGVPGIKRYQTSNACVNSADPVQTPGTHQTSPMFMVGFLPPFVQKKVQQKHKTS